jgi:hypothetical protein
MGACGRRKPYSAWLKLWSKRIAKKVLEDSGSQSPSAWWSLAIRKVF